LAFLPVWLMSFSFGSRSASARGERRALLRQDQRLGVLEALGEFRRVLFGIVITATRGLRAWRNSRDCEKASW